MTESQEFDPRKDSIINPWINKLIGRTSVRDAKNIDDLSFYDRAAVKMQAKTEGMSQGIAGLFGLEDEVGTESQDLLNRLEHKQSDDFGASSNSGGSISGGLGGELPASRMGGSGDGGASSNQGTSLGRALALEEDPALEQTNYNNNNFSF